MSSTLRVDWRASVSLTGRVVRWLTVPMLFPLALALFYGRGLKAILPAIAIAFVVGWGLERLHSDPAAALGAREGFLMVALTWLLISVVGALPYIFEGSFTAYGATSTLRLPVNALFETMSGFTTTGSTVMGDISFETHSRALMMWRQETQWLGGMGIVVLAVAILPELSVGGAQLMDAEAPGPGIQKLTPRIAETARALWGMYIGLTVLEIVGLYGFHQLGMAPEMTLYNAVAHGFTTMPTGGFSPEARSIEAFTAVVQWFIIPFMVAAGTNFALFWHVWNRDFNVVWDDIEFKTYLGAIGVLTAITAGLLFTTPGFDMLTNALEPSLRHATFQIASIVTTTGYASMDFNNWGQHAKYVLLFAMFIGGSAGSTGGGIKIIRWVVILKTLRRELFTAVHPEAVRPVRLGSTVIDEDAIRGIYAFTLLYLVIFAFGTLVVLLVGVPGQELSAFEATSAVAATLGNVGPGVGIVGPMNSFLPFPRASKLLMVFFMWVGRLEIFPVLVLLTHAYWRS
ncbi:TrkH family potassium uptake protein [Halarchaeum nitratireducens]|uniref:Potassium transporter TrkH n=1 Tax=Halarchaeum nitratireducens TaxID=489913 RepID=A0A830GBM3_9EURY|nr:MULTISPECIES: TrkH family potassium uptake protein [Halarchaeum]MBP2252086.1 trk system potassium uptake protein TrkH [Halarchaeum solikamskense]GGN16832.1 potassium transporter TrkH [Halarchaeum nitratireducens]